MKKIFIGLLGLSLACAGSAQAYETLNEDGINYYAPDYPSKLVITTTTNCPDQPMVCKQTDASGHLNCKFDLESSNYYCSSTFYGSVTFWSLDKTASCYYSTFAGYSARGYTLTYMLQSQKNMKCDANPVSGDYLRINY